jgi:hypothetical protein
VLLRAGFIELTEVPRGVDRAPARTFFTWSVNVQKVNNLLLDSFYFTWANVRQRLELETSKIQPFLSKVFHLLPLPPSLLVLPCHACVVSLI